MKPRHPEKINKPSSPIQRKPDWIRVRISNSSIYNSTKEIVKKNKLYVYIYRSRKLQLEVK